MPALHHGQGDAVVRIIDTLDHAEISLPAASTAPRTAGAFGLGAGWAPVAGTGAWSRPSPVRFPHQTYRDDPPGVRLELGGAAVPFAAGVSEGRVKGLAWEVVKDVLFVSSPQDPGAAGARLVDEATARAEDRFDPARAMLPPGDFVRYRATLGADTEEGLLVPPGGAVRLPAVAWGGGPVRLRARVGLAPPGTREAHGACTFIAEADGAELLRVARAQGEPWLEVDASVPAGAGALTLRTAPAGGGGHDHCVWGRPELVGARAEADPLRVVVIGFDTLRPDHLGVYGHDRPTSPGLDALAATSLTFDRTWAPAPRTRPSFRTAFTGRWPLAAIGAPTFGEDLRALGFSTAGFVANVHLTPRLGFADGFDTWVYHDSAPAEDQVGRALAWAEAHPTEDALLFVHLMDPHVFYEPPPPFRDRFADPATRGRVPDRYNRWLVREWEEKRPLSAAERAFITGRYDEEILSADAAVARFVSALDALPGRTLVVVFSDHGEELWDHGAFEHNHTLHEELVRSFLWFRPPGGWAGGPHRIDAVASLADLRPTLLALLGAPAAPTDGVDLSPAFDPAQPHGLGAATADRALPLGHMMFAEEHHGVVFRGHKYVLWTASGDERLWDLGADPAERTDLLAAGAVDAAPFRAALAAAHGAAVGPGWRLFLRGSTAPFTLHFEEPVAAAFVVDPEALRGRRANLEWGEVPPKLPADVATLTLGDGGRTLTVTPGPTPAGVIAIRGPGPEARARSGDTPVRPGGSPSLGGRPVRVVAGTIFEARDSEAARLAVAADPDNIDALRALGYVD